MKDRLVKNNLDLTTQTPAKAKTSSFGKMLDDEYPEMNKE